MNGFKPDWTVAPGETLREWCEDQRVSPVEAAALCRNMRPENFESILAGEMEITPVLAGALQAGTGIPARFWLNLERAYRAGLAEGKVSA